MQNKLKKIFNTKNIPRIFLADKLNPHLSMALENMLQDSEVPSLLINRAKPSIIFGVNQNPYIECDIKQIKNDNIALIRRETGGGAVYLDEGTLMISFNGSKKYPDYNQDNINQIITKTFSSFLKYPAEIVGKNDIKVKIDNTYHKIAGQAFKHSGCDHYKHHLSVLVDTNFDAMQKYLKPNNLKLESKSVKSVRSNVVNMKDIVCNEKQFDTSKLMYDINIQLIKNFINEYVITNKVFLTVIDDTTEDTDSSYLRLLDKNSDDNIFGDILYFTTATLSGIKEISDKCFKLHSDETTFGKTPEFTHQFVKRFEWGTLILQFNVVENIIKNVNCYTDSIEVELPKILNSLFWSVYYNKKTMEYHFDTGIEIHKKKQPQIAGILSDIKKLVVYEIPF